VVKDVGRWRALIREYGRLDRLEGCTAQSRGQRFNGMIAELLECWGIEASANERSKGEIDVGFTVDGVHYVLEAKWEKARADTGHIAKLQKRVRQRLAGTHGVFLAMAGYTPEALADVGDGERLELLLLEKAHWEAMLSGLAAPQELISLARSHAAFHGAAYAPLAALFAARARPPKIEFETPTTTETTLETAVDGCDARVVLSVANSGQLGIACTGPDKLLITTASGIVRAHLSDKKTSAAVPVPGCHRNPVVLADGSILFTRGFGVGRLHEGRLSSVAGGAVGNSCLVQGPDKSVWLFDNGEPTGPTPPSITRVGSRLGDQIRHDLDYPTATATNAAWISPDRLLIIGASGFLTVSLSVSENPVQSLPQSNAMGLTPLAGQRVLTVGDGITLAVTDVHTGDSLELARLALRGSVSELAPSDSGELYLAAYDRTGAPDSYSIVRLNLRIPADLQAAGPQLATSTKAADLREAEATPTPPAMRQEFSTPDSPVRRWPTATAPLDDAVAAMTADRDQERERGYQAGVGFAPQLGWQGLEGLADRAFDLLHWLEGWRNGWLDVQMGRAPREYEAAGWLPQLADHLGTLVDPIGHDNWSFTPSNTFLDGFIDGLRTVWQSTVTATYLAPPPTALFPAAVTPSPPTAGPVPEAIEQSLLGHEDGRAVASAATDPPNSPPATETVAVAPTQDGFFTVKGILGSINFDGHTVTIRKEGHGPRMKDIQILPIDKIEKVIVKPATAMFHGYIQFAVRDHPPAPDRRRSAASGRPHREDPDSMSFPRRACREIEELKERIEISVRQAKHG
jgi:Restriction endonuclease